MRALRIVFMGTPDFAVATLEAVLNAGHKVVGVITAPDKPAGRGRKINQSAVKKYAVDKGLKVLQPTNLKSEEFIQELKSLNANVQVVVAFRMLPKIVWQMPEYGTFNLHASLLPDYRGAAPINWAVINGESKTGITTFFINEQIDTGAVILQEEVPISEDMNVGELHDILMQKGGKLVVDTLHLIADNKVVCKEQPLEDLKPAPKLNKFNCEINWQASGQSIINHIRGLNPYPTAWCTILDETEPLECKIYSALFEKADHQHPIGFIEIQKKYLKVAVTDGWVSILDIKAAGKKRMDIQSFLNGYHFNSQPKMLVK